MGLNWCKYITHEEIAATFAYGLPIISVGSGSGLHERKLEQILNVEIICVDPLVEQFINVDQVPKIVIDDIAEMYTSAGIACPDSEGYYPDGFGRKLAKFVFKGIHRELFHMPDYKTVDDLAKAKPELVGANHLLLIWSSPNNSTYDYDAICALKPKYVTIIYDSTGGAGGEKLHEYIESLEPEQFIIEKENSVSEMNDRFSLDLICIKCNL